jgi:hypothetical protein
VKLYGDPKNVNILWRFLPTGFVDLAMRSDCFWSNKVTLELADLQAGCTFLRCYKVSLIALAILLGKKNAKANSKHVLNF